MAKTQPKVTELVEILLQQVAVLEKSVNQNSQTQIQLSKKMDSASIKVDVSELKSAQKMIRENFQSDFKNFHYQVNKNNLELLKVHKVVSSKRLFYLIFLNVFLFLLTGTSVYIAIKNSIVKSDFDFLKQEKNVIQNKLYNIELFFSKNPKTAKVYEDWSDNQPK